MSTKNANDARNPTRDFPVRSTVPQLAVPLRTMTANIVFLILIPTDVFIAFVVHLFKYSLKKHEIHISLRFVHKFLLV
jgi:hypothetical protein